MNRSIPDGEVRLLGDSAFLIGVADAATGRALVEDLTATVGEEVEAVGAAATVMVRLIDTTELDDTDLGTTDLERLARTTQARYSELAGRHHADSPITPGTSSRVVTIPCRFDGPDLDEVAGMAGCSPDEVMTLLTAETLTAAVVGFSPGFAYLEGLPSALRDVPRRARPRPTVPAGSVAIANGQAAIYPTASPGGWQLVGRTAFTLFSPARPPYAVLAPGDRVRFTVAGAGEQAEPEPVQAPQWSPPAGARRVFDVAAPGLRLVMQDGGRGAVAASGVPAAGPADPVSFALANRLVGNAPGSGTLELTVGGTRLRCLGACHVAVVGAAPDVRVDGSAAPAGQLLPLEAGQALEVGRLHAGCRSYLAIAGGFLGPEWFGSSATDELTGLGAGPLATGDVLHAGAWTPPLGDHLIGDAPSAVDPSSPVELRVLPGPHVEQFDDAALARLAHAVFVVQPASNRVGIRLRAEGSLELRAPVTVGGGGAGVDQSTSGGALDSQGVVTGSVQVPPDGDPVVLLPDHATLGGYPVLAVVVAADLGSLGQCAPGTRLRLVPVTPEAADEARHALVRELARAVSGPYPLAVD
jgi:KipI family sensor histidine kinase inhibitor